MQQPSAPYDAPHQAPMAPPPYNEAVGWNVHQHPPQQQQGVVMQPLHPAPSHVAPPAAPSVQMHVVNVVMVGPKPIHTTCPNCRADVKTTTVTSNKSLAHVGCVALCLTGLWFCCFLPYCFDACKQTEHTCPNCKAVIGVYNG